MAYLDDLHNRVEYDALLRQLAALRDAGVQSPLPEFRDLSEILIMNDECFAPDSGVSGNPSVLREAFILAGVEAVFDGNSMVMDAEADEDDIPEEVPEDMTTREWLTENFTQRLEEYAEDDPAYGSGFTIQTDEGDFTFHFDVNAFYDEMWFITVTETGDTRPLAWSAGWQSIL